MKKTASIFIIQLVSLLYFVSSAYSVVGNESSNSQTRFNGADLPVRFKNEPDAKFKEGELLVKFKANVTDDRKDNLHRKQGSLKIKEFRDLRLHHIKLKDGISVEQAIGLYKTDPDVEYAEPNFMVQSLEVLQTFPNDPLFDQLWGLYNTGQTGGTAGADISTPEAWSITQGSSQVVVAVIDSGIDYSHPDLTANMWVNAGELSGNGMDDDGNGYVDDMYGFDVYNNDGNPMDDNGHGTHVAGTIGAVGNNSLGVVGVNWNVKIMACRFLGAYGTGNVSDAIACLQYVKRMKDRGANIVATNNSWGGGGYSRSLYDAINAQRDILFICAAGNSGTDNADNGSFPADYDLPNVVSVAATDATDSLAYFSNYGKRAVHVGAPGVDIVSLRALGTDLYNDGNHFVPAGDPNALYYRASGTSMAAPHVSGLAALLKAQDMNREGKDIRNLILAGGDSISSLKDTTITGRRINAYGSLTCSDQTIFAVSNCPSSAIPGIPVTISAISINCASPVGTVTVGTASGETITLHDDGIAPDPAAGDGIFNGTWIPSQGGESLEFSFSSPFGTKTETVSIRESPLDAVFNPNADNWIYPIAIQTDGKILIGGNFFHIDDAERKFLARVNADGSLDTSFNVNTGGTVASIVALTHGKILIGGGGFIKRLNPDGSIDPSFQANTDGTVLSIVEQTDGKILVGGFFQNINGVTRNRIARLNADGFLDMSFNPDANSSVMSIALQADGRILIGGSFTAIGGIAKDRIARLNADGSLDISFNASASGDVQVIAVQADGKILVGGYFTTINGVARNCIARLNADGTLDESFNPQPTGDVWSIVVQADGKILIGGSFRSINGVLMNRIARLNADGSLDLSFNPGADSAVLSIAVQSDGKILMGGAFTAVGGIARNYIARLNADTEAVEDLTVDTDGTTMTWMRGGASPEVHDVIFERLTYCGNWTYLGAARRIFGGWELTGISLSGTSSVRARGKSYGGMCNASTSLVESVKQYVGPIMPPPNAPIVSGQTPTNDSTPTWTWNSGGGGGNGSYRYQLDSEAGSWTETTATSYTPDNVLSEGSHVLYVQERNDACTWSESGSKEIMIDVTYSISPESVAFSSNGGDGSITITTSSASCNWNAISNDPWIQITYRSSGTGSGTVRYSVLANTTALSRIGSITVAGQVLTVRQAAATFTDVGDGYWAYPFIYRIFFEGITSGCGNGNYCPDDPVTRAQMAVFLLTAMGEPAASTCAGIFADVNANTVGETFCKFIEKFATLGITGGCGNGNFCPNDPVTREQMAVFMTTALHQGPEASCNGTFNDVNAGSGDLFCRYIEKFATLGITGGCGNGNYCPSDPVTRAQMAVFLTTGFLQ